VLVGEAHLQTSAMNNRDQIANNLVRFTLNNRLYFDQFPQQKKPTANEHEYHWPLGIAY